MIPERVRRFILDNFYQGKIVAITGAGISADCGIPVFRGDKGLWSEYDPALYATPEGLRRLFHSDIQALARFVVRFYQVLSEAKPSFAHMALAELEKRNLISSLITQNIDNLHTRAGNRRCIELHGNAFRLRCDECGRKITLEPERIKEMLRLLSLREGSPRKIAEIFSRYFCRCECGKGRLRADIVLFGEPLPQKELLLAYQSIEKAGLLLVLGTSLTVYPAAELPFYAQKRGVKVLEINKDKTPLSRICDCSWRYNLSEAFKEIMVLLGYA